MSGGGADFEAGRIPGAVHLDLKSNADRGQR